MPRPNISETGFRALTDHDTEAAWITFLSVRLHPREDQELQDMMLLVSQGDGRLYVCNNNVKTAAPGPDTYERIFHPYPFEIILSNSYIDRVQTVSLSFDNIDRTLTDVLRRAEYPMFVDFGIGVVLDVDYYVPTNPLAHCQGYEMDIIDLKLTNITWNDFTINGTLTKDDVIGRAFPSNHPYYAHENFPGLYGLKYVV